MPRSRQRRRRRPAVQERRPASPRSSEDLVRAPRERPKRLTAEPDGQTLEGIIGELRSKWGVPVSPQEYRITIKVAEEKEERGHRTATVEEMLEDPPDDHSVDPTGAPTGAPRREKAPGAPRMGAAGRAGETSGQRPAARRKRGGRRRRGRRGGGGGGGAS